MSAAIPTQRRGDAESDTWPRVRLGEVCEVLIGNSAPQEASCFEGGSYPFVRTSDVGGIHFGILNCSRDMLNDAGVKGLRLFRKGSILFPKSGASAFLNHRVMLGIDAFVSSHLAVIEPSENVQANYLLHYLTTVDTKNLLQNSAYPSLRRGDIATIPLPLPPLAEQRRIASKLDRLCDIVAKRKDQLSQLNQLVKSRFVEMFGDLVKNDKGWPLLPLGKVCDVRDGTHASPQYLMSGYPLMTSKNFTNGYEDFSDVKLISKEDFEEINRRSRVDVGDIVMPMIGTIGNPVIITTRREFAIKNVSLIKFPSPCGIVIGNEGNGVSREIQQICTGVSIPMDDGVESLNASVAGSILMFKVKGDI